VQSKQHLTVLRSFRRNDKQTESMALCMKPNPRSKRCLEGVKKYSQARKANTNLYEVVIHFSICKHASQAALYALTFFLRFLPLFSPGLRSRRFLSGVGFLTTLGGGVGVFLSDSDSGGPIGLVFYIALLSWESWWNGTISYETFAETENSCGVQQFPLSASCYKIVDSQTSFTK